MDLFCSHVQKKSKEKKLREKKKVMKQRENRAVRAIFINV